MKCFAYLFILLGCCGYSASAFAEGSVIYVSFTIEAIADCADLAYRARKEQDGSFSFKLEAERTLDSNAPKTRPSNEELRTAIATAPPSTQAECLIFRLVKNPFVGVKDDGETVVRSENLDVVPPHLAVVFVGSNQNLGYGNFSRIRAINQIGIYIETIEEAIAIAKSRFLMNVETHIRHCVVDRAVLYRDKSVDDEKVWYYSPPINGMTEPSKEELKRAHRKRGCSVSKAVLLFFDDGTFRAPLRRVFQGGNSAQRRHAAFRLRAYADEEVVRELMQVVEAARSAGKDSDDVALAAEQSLHAMGKLKTVSEKASQIYDRYSPLQNQGIFELDVETLQLSWAGESYTPAD